MRILSFLYSLLSLHVMSCFHTLLLQLLRRSFYTHWGKSTLGGSNSTEKHSLNNGRDKYTSCTSFENHSPQCSSSKDPLNIRATLYLEVYNNVHCRVGAEWLRKMIEESNVAKSRCFEVITESVEYSFCPSRANFTYPVSGSLRYSKTLI